MHKILITALVLAATTSSAMAQDLRKNLSINDVSQMLKQEGYTSVEVLDEESIKLRVDGTNFLVLLFEDGDLQMYMGVDAKTSLETINAWNRDKRLSRAYVDSDGDTVIEADLLADQGITDVQFSNFVNVFLQSADVFMDHIN